MEAKRQPGRLLRWALQGAARLRAWWSPPPLPPTERQRARALIAAVDAGGVPMIPRRVNEIARGLGLEVSSRAPVEETIARIRAALARAEP